MFLTYLKRELLNRKRQTLIVSFGMAFAIALVMVVSAVTAGVKQSQDQVLSSLYGIGTDISITKTIQPGDEAARPGRFDFGSDAGEVTNGARTINQARLTIARGAVTFDAAAVKTFASTKDVARVATSLSLNHTTFSGQLPDFRLNPQANGGSSAQPRFGENAEISTTTTAVRPTGGSDGNGGSAFQITSFSVMGVDASVSDAGPMSATTVSTGRVLAETDKGKNVAVLDSSYAVTEKLAIKGTISISGKKFTIVGTVKPNTSATETASNVYIPIDVAQSLSSNPGLVTNVYVQAESGASVSNVANALKVIAPTATVSSTTDLAQSVSGSLSTASDLLGNLGRWLSITVLLTAFFVATMFTMSGVSRRTREFGTLKAIGWRNSQIVRQVGGESLVQGLIGGIFGIGIGFAGISIINGIAPTLTASTRGLTQGAGGFGRGLRQGAGGNGGPPGVNIANSASNGFDVVLHAVSSPSVIISAVGLAILGGMIAGIFGGFRASRLRPAESMRSVA